MITINTPEIRPEIKGDISPIRSLLVAAFPTDAESRVVNDLRIAGALTVSLVAVESGRIIGHIAFSPVSFPELHAATVPTVMALAPLAVLPDAQGRGIGSALVRAGIQACEVMGCDAVVVLGDPAYYSRFGFRPAAEHGLRCLFNAPPEAFMIQETHPGRLHIRNATVHFHATFDRFLEDPGAAPVST